MKIKNWTFFGIFTGLLASPIVSFAQETANNGEAGLDSNTDLVKWLIITAAVIIIIAVLALFKVLNSMLKLQEIEALRQMGMEEAAQKIAAERRIPWWRRLMERWTDAVPVEQEKDVLFDHDFDGIQELDNKLPPWWLALFYVTIGFAVVYMFYYHFLGIGPGSQEMYQQEMKQAEMAIAEYKAAHGTGVDETNVTLLDGETDLAVGQTVYQTHCVACHGTQGEGGIGPNFADNYWIHGCDIKDLFKTIKFGVPEKGMLAWKDQLKPEEIQKVASFILVKLNGTNPPNAKNPQGEPCDAKAAAESGEGEEPADTSSTTEVEN